MPMGMVGGFSAVKPVDDSVKELLQAIKPKVEEVKGSSFSVFECEGYTSQVVAGTNYSIKVRVGQEEGKSHLYLKVFSPLPHTGQPSEVKEVIGPKDGGEDP